LFTKTHKLSNLYEGNRLCSALCGRMDFCTYIPAVWILVGKLEGKRPLGRPRRRWVDNVGMDLQEVGCGCEDWIGLAQDRYTWRAFVSAVRNLRVP
jgi:hypothetical protein